MSCIKKQAPLISIIIPVYNCERYLADAIESVFQQEYQPMELIVIDDGSTDKSGKVAKKFGPAVRYSKQTHSGTGAARNLGIELAKGNYLAFLDSDDLWAKNKLKIQMAAFEEDADIDIISGHVKQFISPELPEQLKKQLWCPENLMPGHIVGAMLIKRKVFKQTGFFNTTLKIGEVIAWYIRAVESKVNIKILPSCVYMRRLHANNKGITYRQSRTQIARILKESLDRRRKEDLLE